MWSLQRSVSAALAHPRTLVRATAALRAHQPMLFAPLARSFHQVAPAFEDESDKTRETRPRRTLLYVPATSQRKVEKAATLPVDCVCLDLEDAVAENAKEQAREAVQTMLGSIDFGTSDVAVRINALTTSHAYEDLRAILTASVPPNTIVVPKVETAAQMEWFFECVDHIIGNERGGDQLKLQLLTQMESPIGLLNLSDICMVDRIEESTSVCVDHIGVIVGGDDYAAAAGLTRTRGNEELLYARQHTVTVCKAYDLQAIDIVNIHYKDPKRLEEESLGGAMWGFTGKQIIHPDQIETVTTAFTPSQEEIDRARDIMQLYQENHEQGIGAFEYKGQMIDMPTIKRCRAILKFDEKPTAASEDLADSKNTDETDSEQTTKTE
eukprot:m.88399 g.88399  ORF g.88399 m.88399 type:complete len:381 (+) comp12859_c0_seq1:99-1241(+)